MKKYFSKFKRKYRKFRSKKRSFKSRMRRAAKSQLATGRFF